MKRVLVLLFALLFTPVAVPALAELASHKASGTVVRIDPASRKAVIKHGPVADLKWPGMTMGFVVKDQATLDKLEPGQKIDFEFVQEGRDYVVVKASPAAGAAR